MFFITQLVYVHPDRESTFDAFEDVAERLIAKYHGEVLLRIRPSRDTVVSASIEVPYEIHLVRFASEEDFRRFSNDEERQRALALKNEAVSASMVVAGTSN